MKVKIKIFAALIISILLFVPELSTAQNSCERTRDLFVNEPHIMFETLLSNNCLGSQYDSTDSMNEIRNAANKSITNIPDGLPNNVASLLKLSAGLSVVKSQIKSIEKTEIGGSDLIDSTIVAIDYAKDMVERLLLPDNIELLKLHSRTVAPLLSYSNWNPQGRGSNSLEIKLDSNYGFQPIKVNDSLIAPNCKPYNQNLNTENCTEAIKIAEVLLRSARAISDYAAEVAGNYIDTLLQHATILDKKWNYYLNDSRAQTIFELKLNSARWRNKTSDYPPGFRSPPSDQIILLHPSVGLEVLLSNDNDEMIKPALFLEVIGYNRWRYKEDGSAGLAIGVSALVAYTGRTTINDWGYGVKIHVDHKYSIALVNYGSDFGIMVSADLWARRDKVRSFFR